MGWFLFFVERRSAYAARRSQYQADAKPREESDPSTTRSTVKAGVKLARISSGVAPARRPAMSRGLNAYISKSAPGVATRATPAT